MTDMSDDMNANRSMCDCGVQEWCGKAKSLVYMGRTQGLRGHYDAVYLLTLILYAHRRTELKRFNLEKHSESLVMLFQQMDYSPNVSQVLSGVLLGWTSQSGTRYQGRPVWGQRIKQERIV